MTDHPPLPVAWTIAGSDCGGGAGIQADLLTFHDLGVYGCSAVTTVTAQNTLRFSGGRPVSPDQLRAQLVALREDLAPGAIKIGMIGDPALVPVIEEAVSRHDCPVILDPVFAATLDREDVQQELITAIRTRLLPLADLVTPNMHEAGLLTGLDPAGDPSELALALCKLGAASALVKGGHAEGSMSVDTWTDSTRTFSMSLPRIATRDTHGGGCTLSSAVAANLAGGWPMADALTLARAYLNRGLRKPARVGAGRNPVGHHGFPDDPIDLPDIIDGVSCPPSPFPLEEQRRGSVYPIVDTAGWVETLCNLGAGMIQLRIKNPAGCKLKDDIRRAVEAGRASGSRVYINDHWREAIAAGAYGVHLGQDDLEDADIMALHNAGIRLGISTHGPFEIARAKTLRPSYIAIGTLFHSPSKTFEHKPLGLDTFTRLRRLTPGPVVAIGGITRSTAPDVFRSGGDIAAVISDITKAEDLEKRLLEWEALMPSGNIEQPTPNDL